MQTHNSAGGASDSRNFDKLLNIGPRSPRRHDIGVCAAS
jgi:hypothetical protein